MVTPNEIVIDAGDSVVCDICNADWSSRKESGGLIFCGYAYCPPCAYRLEMEYGKPLSERSVSGRCPLGVSFADWIRSVR